MGFRNRAIVCPEPMILPWKFHNEKACRFKRFPLWGSSQINLKEYPLSRANESNNRQEELGESFWQKYNELVFSLQISGM